MIKKAILRGGAAATLLAAGAGLAQTPIAPTPAPTPATDRTAFCWAAITNATMRYYAAAGRMPGSDNLLGEALSYIDGKIRGRYRDDDQLVEAMRAGAAEFGRSNIEQAATECLDAYRAEATQFTELTVRSMRR
jgi:hypothetical protein